MSRRSGVSEINPAALLPQIEMVYGSEAEVDQICQACLQPLRSRYVLSLEKGPTAAESKRAELYHPKCLTCASCHAKLEDLVEKRCFVREKSQQVLCPSCYLKSSRCFKCLGPMDPATWAFKLRSNSFHLSCFTCSKCGRQLCQGEKCKFEEENRLLFCAEHISFDEGNMSFRHELLDEKLPISTILDSTDAALLTPTTPTYIGLSVFQRDDTAEVDERLNQLEYELRSSDAENLDERIIFDELEGTQNTSHTKYKHEGSIGSQSNRRRGPCSGAVLGPKTKRIRTSFTPDQLGILQANFDLEANPDGQELERIASSASLNKRVTQVWFQNARARKKKSERQGNLDFLYNTIGTELLPSRPEQHPESVLDDQANVI
ncbi:LIM/homeobox protein Lhx6 [Cichlidogyrus casuarinus]|uniref:LIM/homeobox protein Lhx6 n=1 Tax=Cichlidogyrus casuarinus TaxID=1844966 RepID=A0ABD2Q567_9PLAT